MERVEFKLGYSRNFSLFYTVLFLSTLAIFVSLALPMMVKGVAAALMALHYWVVRCLHIKRTANQSIIKIWQDPKGQWGCETAAGHRRVGVLLGDSFISSSLLVLRFAYKNRSESVIIPIDALKLREYQLLCFRLRFFTPPHE